MPLCLLLAHLFPCPCLGHFGEDGVAPRFHCNIHNCDFKHLEEKNVKASMSDIALK